MKPCATPGRPHPAKHKHGSSKGRHCGPCKTMRRRAREDGRDPEGMGWAQLSGYWIHYEKEAA